MDNSTQYTTGKQWIKAIHYYHYYNLDVQTANPGNPIFSCDRRFTKDVSSWITQQSEIGKEYCMYSFALCSLYIVKFKFVWDLSWLIYSDYLG